MSRPLSPVRPFSNPPRCRSWLFLTPPFGPTHAPPCPSFHLAVRPVPVAPHAAVHVLFNPPIPFCLSFPASSYPSPSQFCFLPPCSPCYSLLCSSIPPILPCPVLSFPRGPFSSSSASPVSSPVCPIIPRCSPSLSRLVAPCRRRSLLVRSGRTGYSFSTVHSHDDYISAVIASKSPSLSPPSSSSLSTADRGAICSSSETFPSEDNCDNHRRPSNGFHRFGPAAAILSAAAV